MQKRLESIFAQLDIFFFISPRLVFVGYLFLWVLEKVQFLLKAKAFHGSSDLLLL